jgi:hypothetical protein
VPPQVTDQPVARGGLGRNLDRNAEQPLPAGHEQRASRSIRVASAAGIGVSRTSPS